MNKKHKHCELIKAWADGAEIEERYTGLEEDKWYEFSGDWDADAYEYRIKPEHASDFGMLFIAKRDSHGYSILPTWKDANLKLIWNGETGELKSAEVLK